MDEREGQGPDRDDIDADHAMLAIEATHDKLLSIEALEAGPEQRGG